MWILFPFPYTSCYKLRMLLSARDGQWKEYTCKDTNAKVSAVIRRARRRSSSSRVADACDQISERDGHRHHISLAHKYHLRAPQSLTPALTLFSTTLARSYSLNRTANMVSQAFANRPTKKLLLFDVDGTLTPARQVRMPCAMRAGSVLIDSPITHARRASLWSCSSSCAICARRSFSV